MYRYNPHTSFSEEIDEDWGDTDPNDQLAPWYPVTNEEAKYTAAAPSSSVVLNQPRIPVLSTSRLSPGQSLLDKKVHNSIKDIREGKCTLVLASLEMAALTRDPLYMG